MKVLQADHIATGHYAGVRQLPNGRYTVHTASHGEKDQTYMLYRLTQEQLARTLMPLSGYSKEEVRAMAREFDLAVAEKPDSQELGIAAGERIFVTRICPESNQVVLGPEESLYHREIRCADLNFLSISHPEPGTSFSCDVKIRYHHPAVPAKVTVSGDSAVVRFDSPVRAPAPGQSAVFYDAQQCVIGGGVITDTGGP